MPRIWDFGCLVCGETDPDKFMEVFDHKRGKRYFKKTLCAEHYRELRARRETARNSGKSFEVKKNAALLRDYGITLQQYYHWLLVIQEGKCPCCGRTPEEAPNSDGRMWPVDHDHKTGAVRGVLCFDCNMALGYAHDQPGTLLGMIDYLRRSQ